MAIEELKKAKQEAEEKETGLKDPLLELGAITSDPSRSELFNYILEQDGDEGVKLKERLAKNELEEGDIGRLEQARQKLETRILGTKKLLESLTSEQLANIAEAENIPGGDTGHMKSFVNGIGAGRTRALIEKHIEIVAVKAPERLKEIEAKIRQVEVYQEGEYRRKDEQVEALYEKYGLKDTNIANIYQMKDNTERADALRNLVKNQMSRFGKVANFLTGGMLATDRATLLLGQRSAMEEKLNELNGHLADVGTVLNLSLDEHQEVRQTFVNELKQQSGTEVKEGVPMSFVEASHLFSNGVDAAEDEWEQYKAEQQKAKKKPNEAEFRMAYLKKQMMKARGSWGSLFGTMFEDVLKGYKFAA
jgi:phosphopantetheine adenylyltransferase